MSADPRPAPTVTLRAAREDDGAALLEWRNDPDAVRFSLSGRTVSDEEHARWFAKVRDGGSVVLWIAEEDGAPVGQVRIDVDGDLGTVSISVDPTRRGRGVGTAMLRAMIDEALAATSVRRLKALVRHDNPASLRAFEAADFHRGAETVGDFLQLEWP